MTDFRFFEIKYLSINFKKICPKNVLEFIEKSFCLSFDLLKIILLNIFKKFLKFILLLLFLINIIFLSILFGTFLSKYITNQRVSLISLELVLK